MVGRRIPMSLATILVALVASLSSGLTYAVARPSTKERTLVATSPAGVTYVARCDSGMVTIGTGTTNGAAGTAFPPIVFVHTSTNPCSLQGYPIVSLTSTPGAVDRRAVHSATRAFGPTKAKQTATDPSQSASYWISYSDNFQVPPDPAAGCRSYHMISAQRPASAPDSGW